MFVLLGSYITVTGLEHRPLLLTLEHFQPFILLRALSGHPGLLLLLLPLSVPLLLRLPFLLFDQVEHHSVVVALQSRLQRLETLELQPEIFSSLVSPPQSSKTDTYYVTSSFTYW